LVAVSHYQIETSEGLFGTSERVDVSGSVLGLQNLSSAHCMWLNRLFSFPLDLCPNG